MDAGRFRFPNSRSPAAHLPLTCRIPAARQGPAGLRPAPEAASIRPAPRSGQRFATLTPAGRPPGAPGPPPLRRRSAGAGIGAIPPLERPPARVRPRLAPVPGTDRRPATCHPQANRRSLAGRSLATRRALAGRPPAIRQPSAGRPPAIRQSSAGPGKAGMRPNQKGEQPALPSLIPDALRCRCSHSGRRRPAPWPTCGSRGGRRGHGRRRDWAYFRAPSS